MKRKVYLLLALIFTLASLLSSCANVSVKTEHPSIGDIQDMVEESGTVFYSDDYAISSTVGGRITSCSFNVGDQVEEGQILYTIDHTDISDRISSAQINLNAVNTAYNQAVKAADDLTVKSYLSGMIAEVYCKTGDYVTTGSKIAQVVDSAHLKLKLAYADIGNIRLGSAAEITVYGDNMAISGTVTKIYEQSTVFPGRQTGTYVEISFNNPGALSSAEKATAMINGVAPIMEGTIEYMTDDAVYSTGTGLITSVNATTGSVVSSGSIVLIIKNDEVTNAVTNARLSVSNAEETLKQLKAQLDHYTIKAPVNGTILERNVKESELATAASTLAIISSGDTINVKADIDEKYISKVSVGQNADITLTADTNSMVYSGTVKEISDSGTVTNGVTYYTVKISLERQDGLKDGMNVDVSILIKSKENCILVPKSYLINENQIEVLENGKTVLKDVEVGITDGKYVEIVSGLSKTDDVISK
ncbi:MAG: efflux RND transporter periplasmic adaptor subunit [Clostridiaceae bacterium]|nr:efflux RND transporter periplasmic adaptor subunit [Clostridiaceae bacterium]